MESVGGSATSMSLSDDEEVLVVATVPVVEAFPKNDIAARRAFGGPTNVINQMMLIASNTVYMRNNHH